MSNIYSKKILPFSYKETLYKNKEVRQNPDIKPKLLSVEEASNYLNIGRSTMYTLLNTREIRAIKIGRRTLIDRSSLDEFIDRQLEYRGELYV